MENIIDFEIEFLLFNINIKMLTFIYYIYIIVRISTRSNNYKVIFGDIKNDRFLTVQLHKII